MTKVARPTEGAASLQFTSSRNGLATTVSLVADSTGPNAVGHIAVSTVDEHGHTENWVFHADTVGTEAQQALARWANEAVDHGRAHVDISPKHAQFFVPDYKDVSVVRGKPVEGPAHAAWLAMVPGDEAFSFSGGPAADAIKAAMPWGADELLRTLGRSHGMLI
jgi:hypothetical protein